MGTPEQKKIGWDWPLYRIDRGPLKGQIYAKSPAGEMVRVTAADVDKEAIELIRKLGPHH